MKRNLYFLVLLIFAAVVSASAQDVSVQEQTVKVPKRKYINLAQATQKLKFDSHKDAAAITLESHSGFAIEFGSTTFFNEIPVAKMIRFGLDFSYIDVQCAFFDYKSKDETGQPVTTSSLFLNLGPQIGPSVTVTPINSLHAKIYVHYAPSLALFSSLDFSDIRLGYAGYVTGGVQVSYRFMTLGVEMREATTKLSTIDVDTEDLQDLMGNVKTRLSGVRFIFGFRF